MTTERLDNLEIKLSFQEQSIADLSATLIEKERRITVLEEAVSRLEKALGILAARTTKREDVAGAHPEEDPVPRSG